VWPAASCSDQRLLTATAMASSARSATLRVKREARSQQPSAPQSADSTISTRIAIGNGASRYTGSHGETAMGSLSSDPHAGWPPHS
jgi:hypothetical protein